MFKTRGVGMKGWQAAATIGLAMSLFVFAGCSVNVDKDGEKEVLKTVLFARRRDGIDRHNLD